MKKSETTIKEEVVLSEIETQADVVKKEEEKEKIITLNNAVMIAPKLILITMVVLGVLIILIPLFIGFKTSVVAWIFFSIGIGILGATGIFLYVCLRRIPARPPYVGVVVIWGKRLPIVIPEGWHVFAPFFPFMYTVTMVNVEKVNIDITFPNIRCKARLEDQEVKQGDPRAGGEISAKISYTYYPDYKTQKSGQRLISFINSGGHEGVQRIVKDLIEEDVREMAHDYSWEQITFSTGDIKKSLVKKLTGEELTEEIAEELNKNGLPDIADLGIKITRFNVGEVKEQGELAIAAGKYAKEAQERRGENEEMEFVREQLRRLKKLGVSPDVALDTIQVERGKAQKDIKAFRGFETTAKALGEGLSGIFKKP